MQLSLRSIVGIKLHFISVFDAENTKITLQTITFRVLFVIISGFSTVEMTLMQLSFRSIVSI